MAYCDFYAVRPDIMDALQFIQGKLDLVFYEMCYESDQELRKFETIDNVIELYDTEIAWKKTRHTTPDLLLNL